MYRFIRRYYTPGLVVLALAGVLAVSLLPVFRGASLPGRILLVAAPLLVWLVLYLHSSQHGRATVTHTMYEGCDPQPLLDWSMDTLNLYNKRGDSGAAIVLSARLDAAAALVYLGRDREALEQLDALDRRVSGKPDVYRFLSLINRSAALLHLGKAQEMRACLDEAGQVLDGIKLKPEQEMGYRHILAVNRQGCRLLAEGPSPELEEELQDFLDSAANQCQKVGFHLDLARCALARGDEEEAEEHLKYVTRHGNKLFHPAEAKALLAQIAQGEPQG